MIHVSRLTKQIPGGPKVLDDITLEAGQGQFIAVKGASGSGKSMLLRCLALREKWSGGTYVFDGTDIFKQGWAGIRKIRREVAYLEEKPVLYPNRTGLKNVLIGSAYQTSIFRRLTGMVRNDDYMGAMDMIEKMGLLDKAHQKVSNMSGGEKQRIAIARALVHGAKVILADEPVSGLDPHAADTVLADLKRLCKEQGLIVIAVLHQGDWAERFADRTIGLNQGRIVLDVSGRRLTEREKMLL
ncbi:ATP-binding cassette domain-containing protein [Paenibacillus cisolokensis]|jgi:phosphonate transport system ATP-binding protein|uniref:Phosphonates import ATP-binding protein PhnC n=1 Tax=Paenibacillus cisolokensis TaxID=1658519 RepID=A0ABQ4N485_9BACL|nr:MULTISPECIES: ATP-binding cassette domain-containing protein [Paenibacillus]ALS28008.1 phosphonate ABC transporter ATP-binding protein [Paenibacillus sp. 32O-W]GIQ62988.1 phosphonates import ATP-binding protein PhnC [Paenibacillus cisolokensis]